MISERVNGLQNYVRGSSNTHIVNIARSYPPQTRARTSGDDRNDDPYSFRNTLNHTIYYMMYIIKYNTIVKV